MRLRNLILGDMRFQKKCGFYFLYTVLTIFYVILILSLPALWKEKVIDILIFSDPAAMGLFFMGAIVLLEKSQRVPWAYAVSPIRPIEYILAKVISLGAIALVVAAILAFAAGEKQILLILLGTALASIVFTLLGIIVATKISSLNQFILFTVPIEILGFVPAVLSLFPIMPKVFEIYPSNVCMTLLRGKMPHPLGMVFLLLLILILGKVTEHSVKNMFSHMGGVKL